MANKAKLNPSLVKKIRRLDKKGLSLREIVKELSSEVTVTAQAVHNVVRKVSWKNV